MTRVAIRADAAPHIGIGHVMRSTTLGASLVRAGAEVAIVTRELPDGLVTVVRDAGIELVPLDTPEDHNADAATTAALADVAVVDGYHLGQLVTTLAATRPVVVFDDNAEMPLGGVAALINQNLHAHASMYPDAGDTRLLLGPSFVLLRDAITAAGPRPAPADDARRVVISLGGADPGGHTLPLAEGLAALGYELRLAVGPANPQRDELGRFIEGTPGVGRDRGDLVTSLLWADIGVVGAGTTLWEVGHLGLPSLAVMIADNQLLGGAAAREAGFVDLLDLRGTTDHGDALDAIERLAGDATARRAMHSAGPMLFDGRGADRAAAAVIACA